MKLGKSTDCLKLEWNKEYKQTYRKVWEEVPEFSGWLQPVENKPNKAFCIYCNKLLHAHRTSLMKHTCTSKHQKSTNFILKKLSKNHENDRKLNIEQKLCKINDVDLKINDIASYQEDEMANGTYDDDAFISCNDTIKSNNDIIPQHENSTYYIEIDKMDDSNEREIFQEAKEMNEPVEDNSTIEMSSPITSHVLDTSIGRPARNIPITFCKLHDNEWLTLREDKTDDDGRVKNLISKNDFNVGCYKIQFHVSEYFTKNNVNSFYPFVEIVFNISDPTEHYHVPLLISPFGYSTYRGS